jgi:hypothetical protein
VSFFAKTVLIWGTDGVRGVIDVVHRAAHVCFFAETVLLFGKSVCFFATTVLLLGKYDVRGEKDDVHQLIDGVLLEKDGVRRAIDGVHQLIDDLRAEKDDVCGEKDDVRREKDGVTQFPRIAVPSSMAGTPCSRGPAPGLPLSAASRHLLPAVQGRAALRGESPPPLSFACS